MTDDELRRWDFFTGCAIQNSALFTKRELEDHRALALKARRIARALLETLPDDPVNARPKAKENP